VARALVGRCSAGGGEKKKEKSESWLGLQLPERKRTRRSPLRCRQIKVGTEGKAADFGEKKKEFSFNRSAGKGGRESDHRILSASPDRDIFLDFRKIEKKEGRHYGQPDDSGESLWGPFAR